MIPRYEQPEISRLWDDHAKFAKFLQVELAILEALEEHQVPKGIAQSIKEKVKINPTRIEEIEAEVKHDVIAFCSSITEQLPVSEGKFFHFGVTSSDIIDTAFTLQIRDSLELIIRQLKKTCLAIHNLADRTRNIMALGRSHGMNAEPLSFGGKWLGYYAEFSRRLKQYQDYARTQLTGQFSGAVGNYAILTLEQEEQACRKLGLKAEATSTQVIPRDRHAELLNLGALLGCAIERISVEIRHLHHSDIGEVSEGFSKGQKGSSTMPHKKNPISTENLSGMARLLRSHSLVGMENTILWHERDISHSSAERITFPDHFGILFYSLKRLTGTLDNLEIHKERIESKVKNQSVYLSSYYMHQLLTLTPLKREEIYPIVQSAAFEAEKSHDHALFSKKILEQLEQKKLKVNLPVLNEQELRKIYLSYIDGSFKRVLKEFPLPSLE
jgi:adenylosuccinate lyase